MCNLYIEYEIHNIDCWIDIEWRKVAVYDAS